MAKQLNRLRAHKRAVKAEALKAKKRNEQAARDAAHKAAPTSSSSSLTTKSIARGRTDKHNTHLKKALKLKKVKGAGSNASADDAKTGELVKRLLGDMALDSDDEELSSVRLAAAAAARSGSTRAARDATSPQSKRQRDVESDPSVTTRVVKKAKKGVGASASSFAIPLEGDGDSEDEDMSREVALAASQFFSTLKPNQQKNFWSLRHVAQGTASSAEMKMASGARGEAEETAKKKKKAQLDKTKGSSTADADDDLSFGYLMGSSSSSSAKTGRANVGAKDASFVSEEESDEAASDNSDSSSEPSWIPESDDEPEDEDEDEEEESSSGSSEVEAPRRRTPTAAPTKPHRASADVSASSGKKRVVVHQQKGKGGRLFALQEEDDTWDD